MSDALAWTLALGTATALLAAAPLAPALAELRRGRARPLHIPTDDEAGAGFFAQRMRDRVRLELADWPYLVADLPTGWARAGGEALEGRHGRADAPADTLVGHDVRLARECRYLGDVVAIDALDVGTGAVLRAALVDRGEAHLQADASVLRWIHAVRIVAGDRARLLGRATADEHVRLGAGVEFRRIAAPRIEFGGAPSAAAMTDARDVDLREATGARFLETAVEQGRWVCRGDLRIPDGARVHGHVIVEGRLDIGSDAEILGSVKAHRGLHVGDRTRIAGSVFAGRDAMLGHSVRIEGMCSAAWRIDAGSGLRIGLPDRPASMLAPVIRVGAGTLVHGAVWASRHGEVAA